MVNGRATMRCTDTKWFGWPYLLLSLATAGAFLGWQVLTDHDYPENAAIAETTIATSAVKDTIAARQRADSARTIVADDEGPLDGHQIAGDFVRHRVTPGISPDGFVPTGHVCPPEAAGVVDTDGENDMYLGSDCFDAEVDSLTPDPSAEDLAWDLETALLEIGLAPKDAAASSEEFLRQAQEAERDLTHIEDFGWQQ